MKRILLLISAILLTLGTLQAQQDCPQVDCPGRCGRFVDGDGDGFCDHGQLSQPKEATVKETPVHAAPKTSATTDATTATTRHGQPEQTDATTGATQSQTTETQPAPPATAESDAETETEEAVMQPNRSPYPILPIIGGTLLLYLISFILVKTNVLQKATHRKIWNVLLGVTFLGSCLVGLLLAIFIHYNYYPKSYLTLVHLHVWFGLVMTVIAFFHMLWHVNYFKALFKKSKPKDH